VTVLSVQVPLTGLALEALIESTAVAAYESNMAEVVAQTGRVVAEKAAAAGVVADFVALTQELPAQAIVDTAAARGCDLIVMTSHGRRGITRLVLGSQTAEVLSLAQVPVLVVR
jgi:nucleotide-binding universal stress UspA family protein